MSKPTDDTPCKETPIKKLSLLGKMEAQLHADLTAMGASHTIERGSSGSSVRIIINPRRHQPPPDRTPEPRKFLPEEKPDTNRLFDVSDESDESVNGANIQNTVIKLQDFAYLTFKQSIHHPFAESRLKGEAVSAILNIQDQDSLDKARVSAISMVLFLSNIAVYQHIGTTYSDQELPLQAMEQVISHCNNIFDALAGFECIQQTDLPEYATGLYFAKWRERYQESFLTSEPQHVKINLIKTFFQQSTFAYDNEPAINTTPELILFFGEDVFDNYRIRLRNLLGENVLP